MSTFLLKLLCIGNIIFQIITALFMLSIIFLAIFVSLNFLPHRNSLLKTSPTEAAQFLVIASRYGEQQLYSVGELDTWHNPGGQLYGECMDGIKKDLLVCSDLNDFIMSYADKMDSKFQGLRYNDLKNKSVWQRLRPYYETDLKSR